MRILALVLSDFFGADGAIGPDFQDQLVVIGALSDAGRSHIPVDPLDRAVDRIHRQLADGQAADAVIGRGISPSALTVISISRLALWIIHREQIEIGVHDLDFRRGDDIASGHLHHRRAPPGAGGRYLHHTISSAAA